MLRFLAPAFAGLTCFFSLSIPAATVVFVNEFHYDNAGADVGEAVEVAGPAGTDLSGWHIDLYNGSGGAVYGSASLSGTLPNQQNGYGTLAFSGFGSIQNGPDGMALIDASGSVAQFLSYEGTLTATEGAASGLTSVDIGVSETAATPVGYSLQLVGSGQFYEDFVWAAPSADSFDAVNAGQTFVPLPAPLMLLISGLIGLGFVAKRR